MFQIVQTFQTLQTFQTCQTFLQFKRFKHFKHSRHFRHFKHFRHFNRIGAGLIRRFGCDTPEGVACQKHLDDMATMDSFQFIECEGMKALQSAPPPPTDCHLKYDNERQNNLDSCQDESQGKL